MAAIKNREGRTFRPGWKLTLFVILLLPVLVGLGFWQLNRAAEKRDILASQAALSMAEPIDFAALGLGRARSFQRLRLTGEYVPDRYYLLDNQHFNGRLGYGVVAAFRDRPTGQLVLVSRGWVPADPDRSKLPEVPQVTGDVVLEGNLYIPPAEPFLLAPQDWSGPWPKVIQAIDTGLASATLGEPVFPYTVRLAPGAPGVLERHWQTVNVMPAKHTAYAVQWFAMAAALVVLYLLTGLGILGRNRPA